MKMLTRNTVLMILYFFCLILGEDKRETELSSIKYNIKKNGAMLSLDYSNSINNEDIVGWKSDRNWLYLTLLGVKSTKYKFPQPVFREGSIKDVIVDDMGESVQIAVLMDKPIQWYDIVNSEHSNSSVVMIRTEMKLSNHANLKRHFDDNSGSTFVAVSQTNNLERLNIKKYSLTENKTIKKETEGKDIQWSDGLPEKLKSNNSRFITPNKFYESKNTDSLEINEKSALLVDTKREKSFLKTLFSRKKKKEEKEDNEFILNPMYEDKSIINDKNIIVSERKAPIKNRKQWRDTFIKLKKLNKTDGSHKIKSLDQDNFLTEEMKNHSNSQILLERLIKNNKGLLSRKNIQKSIKADLNKKRFNNYNHSAILIDTNIDGVPIYIDGRYVGHSPLEKPIKVEPGWHQISGFSPQYLMYLNTGSINYVDHQNNNRVFGNETIFVENGKVAYSKMSFDYKGPKLPAKLKKSNMKLSIPFVLLFVQLVSWATT